jgi:hypothetical protein
MTIESPTADPRVLRCKSCGERLGLCLDSGALLVGSVLIERRVPIRCVNCRWVRDWKPPALANHDPARDNSD